MKKIAVKHKGGTVSIVTCLVDDIGAEMERIKDSFEHEVISWREIDDSKLPDNREFRDAWTDDMPTDTIDIDPVKKTKMIAQKTLKENK